MTRAEQQRVDAALRALRPVLARRRARGHRRPNRPPLEARPSAAAVRAGRARRRRLGLPGARPRAAVGGASDGNFTAGVGTPTLDGLGAVGGGAHADDEHVLVDELPGRTVLLARAGRGPAGRPTNGPRRWCGRP